VRANRAPLGDLTPLIDHTKVKAEAISLRDQMADCTLSEQCIQLIALRVNTSASVPKIARMLGINTHHAYIMLGKPQARDLMAQLAATMLGEAAITGVHTMVKLMKGRDAHLAYRAADTMMERAGLGVSQRSTPDGSTKTVFQFAFGAPQAEASPSRTPGGEAGKAGGMGPVALSRADKDPAKSRASGSGEGDTPAILQPVPDDPSSLAPLKGVR
jgi:hypothetical protein